MKKLLLLCLSVLTASCDTATRQFESRLDEILSGHKAFVGVAVRTPGGETIARNDTLLPMMSVFKFPVALAVLDRMQREGIPLTQPISITPDLLLPGTYSPMRDSLPAGGGTLTLGQLLRYMVSKSDNIACDILLREAGGPEAVEAYVRSLGIGGIRIAASEEEMIAAYSDLQMFIVERLPFLGLVFRTGSVLSTRSLAGLSGTRENDVYNGLEFVEK